MQFHIKPDVDNGEEHSAKSDDEVEEETEDKVNGKMIERTSNQKSSRRSSNQPYISNKHLQKEIISLKELNNRLTTSQEAVREKAIEALIEKEQVILNLQQKLEETENFYKDQVIALSSELQKVYQQRDEQTQAIVRLEREGESHFDDRFNELSNTIRRLHSEIEAREREIEEMTNSIDVRVNELVHEKLKSNYDLERRKKEDMLIDTLSKIDDRDAVIRKAELRVSELCNKLEILEKKYHRDIEESSKRLAHSSTEHEEEIIKLRNQHARQIEKQDLNWIEQISSKSSQISELEKTRQTLLAKIANLQEENREIREINANLQVELKQNESYKAAYKEKLREMEVNYEEQMEEMERKISQERYFWNLRDIDSKLKSPFRVSERKSDLIDTRKTLESEIGQFLKSYEQPFIHPVQLSEGEKYIHKLNKEGFNEDNNLERTLKKKGGVSKHGILQDEQTASKDSPKISCLDAEKIATLQDDYEYLTKQIDLKKRELDDLNSEIVTHKKKCDKKKQNMLLDDKYIIKITESEEKSKPVIKYKKPPRFIPFGGLGLFFKNQAFLSSAAKNI